MKTSGIRPTASTIIDDQVDALWDLLEAVEALHYPHEEGDRCTECGQTTPCRTIQSAKLARIRIEVATCQSG